MEFLRLLESIRIPALNVFFSGITYCGDEIAFMVAAFALFWCVNKTDGILCVSGRPVRHSRKPVAEDRVPHSAAVGA